VARKIPSLQRFLGTPGLFATAYGEIGSSLYFALGITAVYALSLTPVVFLAAGLVFALAAAAYAEAGATIPEPGGASSFARRAFNDLVGFIAGWATVLDYVIVIALSALFLPHYMAGMVGEPQLFGDRGATAVAIAVLLAVTTVRLLRRPNVYTAGIVIAALDLAVQLGLAVLGLILLFSWDALSADINLGTEPSWNSLAFAFPIAMLAFTGLEKVAGLAGLAKDPEKSLPSSVRTSVITVVLIYAAVATAAVSAFPSHPAPGAPAGYASGLSTTWRNAPLLGLAHAIGEETSPALGDVLRVIVGATACLILLTAIVTSFSGCARLAGAMGDHAQLPGIFARRSRRTLSPPAAIACVGVLACACLLGALAYGGSEALALGSIYSFGILIAFMLIQASVIWLRIVEPSLRRPFLMHGNVRVRGRLIPLTSCAGIAAAFVAWIIALGTHPGARVIGPIWMLAGLVMYAAVRVGAGYPLMGRVSPAAPPPSDITDVAYGAIVVPLERLNPMAEEMAATACQLAADSDASVIGVTCIKVPLRQALDVPLPERDGEAAQVQAMAASLAREYGVDYRGIVVRTRNPGRAIVDAADESGASLIVIGSPQKPRVAKSYQEEFFGKTVDFVLRKADTRVIVTHFPAEAEIESALPTG
jgi:basic amino acid/polyamine antiporter, APA family